MPELPETAWRIVLYFLAAAGIGGGFLMAWKGRRSGGVSPTRTLLALSLGVLGYHAAAYASPATWFPIQVPVDRFWLVLLLICVGLSVSAWLDRLQATDAQNVARRDERKNH